MDEIDTCIMLRGQCTCDPYNLYGDQANHNAAPVGLRTSLIFLLPSLFLRSYTQVHGRILKLKVKLQLELKLERVAKLSCKSGHNSKFNQRLLYFCLKWHT